jgi:hypothetical protein
MGSDELFSPGRDGEILPKGDAARQAIDSLRGYAYQVLAAALAWIDLGENDRLFLEVAEDYAIVANDALSAVQVKDTENSGSITLNSESVRGAVAAFVDLVARNPKASVHLRYLTTSEMGTERAVGDRPAGLPGLEYWRRAAGGADISPLRSILESDSFPEPVRVFVKARDDAALRSDLLRRIHWDCGQPNLSTLRRDIEDRLVVVGRKHSGLPADEARRLADPLVYRTLEKSVAKNGQERVLTLGDLYAAIDAETRISVPRTHIDALERLISNLAGRLGGTGNQANSLSVDDSSWIITSTTLPAPRAMISRPAIESRVIEVLQAFGTCVLVGGSGLGKSTIARSAALAWLGEFTMADFRGIDPEEQRRRLNLVFAQIGGLPSSMLILEDLNYLEEGRVQSSLAQVIEALRRRDKSAVITCYRKPPITALVDAGLDPDCIIECPYFSEAEVASLVQIHGGEPDTWGTLSFAAGAGGHPQLTHAFVVEMARRGWPVDKIRDIVIRGFSSEDTEAERDAVRRNIALSLPEGSRNILYRLSLTAGPFNRSLALAIGALSPAIPQSGECLDELIGPWIEILGHDRYRISPLASRFGQAMLTEEEKTQVHETIAVQMLRKQKIDGTEANTLLMHAMLGKSAFALAMVAQSILTANSRTLEFLGERLFLLGVLRAESPIFPENPGVSGLLRLAQFRLVAITDRSRISPVVAALFDEISVIEEGQFKQVLEAMALTAVLGTMSIANELDSWITLLHRFKTIVEADEFLEGLQTRFEQKEAGGTNIFGALFSIGSSHLGSVERLERVVDGLDELAASERAQWLTPVDKSLADYSVLVNGPWVAEEHKGTLNSGRIAQQYRRLAERTQNWGIRALTIQCWLAQAVMLDEYENKEHQALAVLDEAVTVLGYDPMISRARAKIYRHHGQDAKALEIFRDIADQLGADSVIDRAFALREAAISAAKCNDWKQARDWFIEAQRAAQGIQGDAMRAMATGLGVDAAVAELELRDIAAALKRLVLAVGALPSIDPEASLAAAYCHRVIRHAVLWAQSRIEGREIEIGGKPIEMQAGACSNPDPPPAIREQPMGPLDLSWYMLAQAETSACLDIGITSRLYARLAQGKIPVAEMALRTRQIQVAIDRLDPIQFATHFMPYIEVATYMIKESARIRKEFSPLAPERGEVPALDEKAMGGAEALSVARDTIIAYGIRAALERQSQAITEAEAALDRRFEGSFLGKSIFSLLKGAEALAEDLDKTIASIIRSLLQEEHSEPRDFWMAGLRFFERSNHSGFRDFLTSRIAEWQRAGWVKILAEESFRLKNPRETVPAIERVLRMPEDDRRFLATLLLTTASAVGTTLHASYVTMLEGFAAD